MSVYRYIFFKTFNIQLLFFLWSELFLHFLVEAQVFQIHRFKTDPFIYRCPAWGRNMSSCSTLTLGTRLSTTSGLGSVVFDPTARFSSSLRKCLAKIWTQSGLSFRIVLMSHRVHYLESLVLWCDLLSSHINDVSGLFLYSHKAHIETESQLKCNSVVACRDAQFVDLERCLKNRFPIFHTLFVATTKLLGDLWPLNFLKPFQKPNVGLLYPFSTCLRSLSCLNTQLCLFN